MRTLVRVGSLDRCLPLLANAIENDGASNVVAVAIFDVRLLCLSRAFIMTFTKGISGFEKKEIQKLNPQVTVLLVRNARVLTISLSSGLFSVMRY